jgi:hypothetical protein
LFVTTRKKVGEGRQAEDGAAEYILY